MRIHKTPDLNSWKKIGKMKSALGTEYFIYESPDETKIAQVDKDLMIYLILQNGNLTYINPKTTDGLKRMNEVKKYLKGKTKVER